ncbi:MAG: sulfotransferase [Phycisphaerales bacterium]|nr:MAG: sulfotransferase [Phycisphaerales bacterium]
MAAQQRHRDYRTPLRFTLRKLRQKITRRILQPKIIRQDRLVVVDESDRCTNPIFLIGLHRSGTTLMRQIVDSHSRIACPAESFFLTGFNQVLQNVRYQRGLQGMGFDRQATAQGLNRAAGYFFDNYRRSKGKPRWADKTPEYVRILPFIEEVFGPTCQYVMLYRHPLDVINSLLASGWDFNTEQWECLTYHEDHFLNVVSYHADVLQRQLDFQYEHESRCHVIRYEELVADPANILPPMFEFLGEPWEPEVLAFHEKSHDRGVGDGYAPATKGFRPSVGNWKDWNAQQIEQARSILARQLEQLGYSIDD